MNIRTEDNASSKFKALVDTTVHLIGNPPAQDPELPSPRTVEELLRGAIEMIPESLRDTAEILVPRDLRVAVRIPYKQFDIRYRTTEWSFEQYGFRQEWEYRAFFMPSPSIKVSVEVPRPRWHNDPELYNDCTAYIDLITAGPTHEALKRLEIEASDGWQPMKDFIRAIEHFCGKHQGEIDYDEKLAVLRYAQELRAMANMPTKEIVARR